MNLTARGKSIRLPVACLCAARRQACLCAARRQACLRQAGQTGRPEIEREIARSLKTVGRPGVPNRKAVGAIDAGFCRCAIVDAGRRRGVAWRPIEARRILPRAVSTTTRVSRLPGYPVVRLGIEWSEHTGNPPLADRCIPDDRRRGSDSRFQKPKTGQPANRTTGQPVSFRPSIANPRCRVKSLMLLCILLCMAGLLPPASAQEDEDGSLWASRANRWQWALDIRFGRSDVLGPLRRLAASLEEEGIPVESVPFDHPPLQALIEAIEAGPPAEALYAWLLEPMHPWTGPPDEQAAYTQVSPAVYREAPGDLLAGVHSPMAWLNRLHEGLWTRLEVEQDLARRRGVAKAAIYLDIQTPTGFHITRYRKVDELRKRTRLPRPVCQRLVVLGRERMQSPRIHRWFSRLKRRADRLNDPLKDFPASMDRFMETLEEARKRVGGPDQAWRVMHESWAALNTLHGLGEEKAIQRLEAYLHRWRVGADRVTARWIEAIIKTRGPVRQWLDHDEEEDPSEEALRTQRVAGLATMSLIYANYREQRPGEFMDQGDQPGEVRGQGAMFDVLIRERYFGLDYALKPGGSFREVPNQHVFEAWPRRRRIRWLEAHAAYWFVPGLGRVLEQKEPVPIVMERPGLFEDDRIAVGWSDGRAKLLPVEAVRKRIEEATGRTLEAWSGAEAPE